MTNLVNVLDSSFVENIAHLFNTFIYKNVVINLIFLL
jgi:hypothetical protein